MPLVHHPKINITPNALLTCYAYCWKKKKEESL